MADVIVVGAGAAGCEAAVRLARGGLEVLLLTTSLDTVFSAGRERVAVPMSSGTLGAELMPLLNVGEDGTAAAWDVHAEAKYVMEREPNIHLMQSNVDRVLLDASGRVSGVETWEGIRHRASRLALCVGPFLKARLVSGSTRENAGRPGEMAYDDLAVSLEERGLRFVPEVHEGGGGEIPRWQGEFLRFANDQVSEYRVVGVEGLYASGIVVRGSGSYDQLARDGQAMVDVMMNDVKLEA